jgi:D-alanyl-D-alanine dipeptidase
MKATNLQYLPENFVYLSDIDPSIIIDLRYTTNENFLGTVVRGYEAAKCILTNEAASALMKAQQLFKKDGYGIVVYDSYRPQQAVDHFVEWRSDPEQKMKERYYPRVEKSQCFELGYIAERSTHTRGSTVDLSIIELGKSPHEIIASKRALKDGFEIIFLDDGTVDMGCSFDLFDTASHYSNDLISQEHKERRKYLKETMEACGFEPYAGEWWHFKLKDEPFPDKYFNFPVK